MVINYLKSPGTRYLSWFPDLLALFELYRSWRFTREIVEYAVYALNFVDDPVHAGFEYLKRNVRDLCGHEIIGFHSTKHDSIIIGSEITHDADGAHIRESCKVLRDLSIQPAFAISSR